MEVQEVEMQHLLMEVNISGNSATLDASTLVSTDTPKIIKATLTEGEKLLQQ